MHCNVAPLAPGLLIQRVATTDQITSCKRRSNPLYSRHFREVLVFDVFRILISYLCHPSWSKQRFIFIHLTFRELALLQT